MLETTHIKCYYRNPSDWLSGWFGTERGDNSRIQSGHLCVLKSPLGDDPEQNPGTIHSSNPDTSLFWRLDAGPIRNNTRGLSMRPIRNTYSFLRLQGGIIQSRRWGQSTRPTGNTSWERGRVDQWEAWKLIMLSQSRWEASNKMSLLRGTTNIRTLRL